jgi:flavin-dependent dehydrogenase
MTSLDPQFEVGIIGGGPAGSAAAITLARAGRNVLLIEKADRETFKVGESLPPAITPLLRELGVLDRFKSDQHLISCGNESSWGGASLESSAFIQDANLQGWHVDRARFDAMLRDAAREAGARVLEATRVAKCERCEGGDWRLGLEGAGGSSQAQASWLIDCTGRRSWLARREGVKRRAYDNLMAFVGLFQLTDAPDDSDSDSLTLVESVEDGWWYTVRVPNGRRVVVYLTDTGTSSANTARHAEGYHALVEETVYIRSRLLSNGYAMTGAPMITSSNSSRLERVAGAGWLAAGDAATSFDPLSSQGVLTAAYSGLKAGRALDGLLSGDFESLRAYELRIGTVYDAYLNNRVECYRFEQRWQQSEFWRARRQILGAVL